MRRTFLPIAILGCLLLQSPLTASGGWSDNDSLRYKIGQMLIFGFWGDTVPEHIKNEIRDYNIGGVLLYRVYDNLATRTRIPGFIADLQSSAEIPLLIVTDQEGGTVTNLNIYNGFQNTKTAYELGELTDETTTRKVGAKFANWFTELGINTNFAPVVDLRLQPDNVIGDRSFGADPDTVIQNAYWFIDEFHKQNHLTTLKHFPGHGSSIGDSHLGFTDVSDTWSETELIPFKALIDSGCVDMVMTAHIFNANLDPQYPATLSQNTITNLLRDTLEFDGVIVTDAMMMRAITDHYGLKESITLAINAGCDLILYNWDDDLNNNRLAPLFVNHVEEKVLEGTIPQDRINESYQRILHMKSDLPENTFVFDDGQVVPTKYDLSSYPNPFNSQTTIAYHLEAPSEVLGVIYNLLGYPIRALLHGSQDAGHHTVTWDATDDLGNAVPTGIYILNLRIRYGQRSIETVLKLNHVK